MLQRFELSSASFGDFHMLHGFMPALHFIWWGPFRGADCVAAPNAISSAVGSHEVIYWCQAEHRSTFSKNLKCNITVKACDDITRIFEGDTPAWTPTANNIIQTLAGARAYAAVKDLLSLIILLKHGGCYIDTTCQLSDDTLAMKYGGQLNVTAQSLKNFLSSPPSEIRFPQVRDLINHMPFIMTASAIIQGIDVEAALDSSGEVSMELYESFAIPVPHVDVWAINAPAGHRAVQVAVESYISRCVRMGLDGTDSPTNFDGVKGSHVLAVEQNGRDDLIGSLIVRAVLDGLIAYTHATDAAPIAPLCWKVGHLDEAEVEATNGGIDIVPELGITKRYSGSWRHQS